MKSIGLVIVVILTLGVFFYTGCDDAEQSTLNRSPVIQDVETKTECVKPSSSLSISCVASDADGDVLTYIWSATAGTFLGEGREIFWQVPEVPGKYDIRVEVADGRGGGADSDLVVNVRDNNPPVIDSLTADQSEVEQGKTAIISCVAFDPDGDELIYYWSVTNGNISGKGAEATWVAPVICDTNIILVEIVDSCGLTASKKLKIEVTGCAPASTPKAATDDIPGTEDEVLRVTVEELWQKMESGADIIVIDVRKQAEYETGHIKGAISGPGEKIYLGEWKPPKGKELILY